MTAGEYPAVIAGLNSRAPLPRFEFQNDSLKRRAAHLLVPHPHGMTHYKKCGADKSECCDACDELGHGAVPFQKR
jgi:hypothetical protein